MGKPLQPPKRKRPACRVLLGRVVNGWRACAYTNPTRAYVRLQCTTCPADARAKLSPATATRPTTSVIAGTVAPCRRCNPKEGPLRSCLWCPRKHRARTRHVCEGCSRAAGRYGLCGAELRAREPSGKRLTCRAPRRPKRQGGSKGGAKRDVARDWLPCVALVEHADGE